MTNSNNNDIWVFLSHSNKGYEEMLNSDSGSFYVNENGVAQHFEPATDNPFIEDESEMNDNYIYPTHKSIRTFIVPKGVKGFADGFMRGIRVIERFELPDGLLRLGNNSFNHDSMCNCIFANCVLPSVVIPDSVVEIGIYAFGHTHIDSLQLPESLHSPYGRQFKDSYIGTLRLPIEWKEDVKLGDHHDLQLLGQRFNNDEYGYLKWPSTIIKKIDFY